MVGWHHRLDAHEFKQIPGDSEGQGNLACCSPWGCRVRHTLVTEQKQYLIILSIFSCILVLSIILCGGAGGGLVTKLCPTLLQPHGL